MRAQVQQLTDQEHWVCDGNYSQLRNILWQRADTVIWLNYPFPTVFWRLMRRTLQRSFGKVELWNGNRESWQTSFFLSDSILLWLLQSYPRHLSEYPQLLKHPQYMHLKLFRFRRPQAAQSWLAALPKKSPETFK